MTMPLPSFPADLSCQQTYKVQPEMLASVQGNPTPAHVLSSPAVLACFENTASLAMLPYLGNNFLILGIRFTFCHRRPAPLGAEIAVTATLLNQQGNKLTWKVSAVYQGENIADGEIKSALVPVNHFRGIPDA